MIPLKGVAAPWGQQKKPFFVPGIQRRLNALLREVQHKKMYGICGGNITVAYMTEWPTMGELQQAKGWRR